MKILVTGFTGYVGSMIYGYFGAEHDVFGTSNDCCDTSRTFNCDLCSESAVRHLSSQIQPDIVIHAAGQKDISFCENNPDKAFAINSQATEHVAKLFGKNSRMLYISTDYVFEGTRGNYSEDDTPAPVTVYGKSKLLGEQQGGVLAGNNFSVIRTAALYNDHSKFIEYLTGNLSTGQPVSCYTDTYYSPTYYKDLLSLLQALVTASFDRRIYHVCGNRASRYEFAAMVAKAYDYDQSLVQPALHDSQNWFLLPDLSMSSEKSQILLGHCQTSHSEALQELATKRRIP